jgi:hypothetical protein
VRAWLSRAWLDPAYKARLLADGTAAIVELGFGGPEGEHIVVVENTPSVHNVVVCTLCSCYPWPVLGLPPPNWYKDAAYRSRVVREPRIVLRELGLRPARRCRDPRLGLQRRNPLHGVARAARRQRRARGRGAGDAGHPRRDDRHGPPVTRSLDPAVAAMPEPAALPRRNGELVFDAPWQGRAFGLALVIVDRLGLPWARSRST